MTCYVIFIEYPELLHVIAQEERFVLGGAHALLQE
jgi:hypothetical protein